MKQLAKLKAPEINGIPAALLKPIPAAALTTLYQRIWRMCEWLKEWKRSVFIPILKKGDTKDCLNYGTIALIPHTTKVLLKIIQQRLSTVVNKSEKELKRLDYA